MLKLISRIFLAAIGWRTAGAPPAIAKYVLIAAPHTSNWDLVIMVASAATYGLTFSFMAKHTLFWWPLGPLLRSWGGVPIDRGSSHNVVDQVADAFRAAEQMVVSIPAEGTRGRVEYWKSGFYHIAKAAGVPIVLGTLDYGPRETQFGPVLSPDDDVRDMMDQMRAFYADKQGKYPDQFGPVRLRDEEQGADKAASAVSDSESAA